MSRAPADGIDRNFIIRAALWVLVLLSILSFSDTAPLVLFEPGQPDHALLVLLFVATSVPVFFDYQRRRWQTRAHLLVVGILISSHPFAPIFERDGLLLLLMSYFLVVLFQRTAASPEAKLAWVSVFVGISLLEVGLAAASGRAPDSSELPDYGDLLGTLKAGGVLRPSLDVQVVGEEGPARFITNELGFRNRAPATQRKPAGEIRILFVGDSFVGGYRMDQEDTVGKQLEEILSKDLSRTVSVWIVAVGGLEAYAEYVRQYAFEFEPDLVLFGITLGNDLGSAYASSLGLPLETGPVATEMLPQDAYKGGWRLLPLRAHRSLRSWRWYRLLFAIVRPEGITSWHADAPLEVHMFDGVHGLGVFYVRRDLASLETMHDAVATYLSEIGKACRENATSCVSVLIPQRFQVSEREWDAVTFDYALDASAFDTSHPNSRIEEACADAGLICLDLLPVFRETNPPTYLPRGDMHWNAAGHAVAAAMLASTLRDSTFLGLVSR